MTFLSGNEVFLKIAAVTLIAAAVLAVLAAALKWTHDRSRANRNTLFRRIVLLLFTLAVLISLFRLPDLFSQNDPIPFEPEGIGPYTGSPYTVINDNKPYFTKEETGSEPYLFFSDLDELGRCGYAMAMLEKSMMPKEDRGDIESIRPSGYHNAVYEDLIEDGFLYNRCHLIGFQLCGENANEKNLITGTRYMNVEGMEPFENEVASCIRRTGKHVLLRVTPVFAEKELVARGVLMEAYSVEDQGQEISFCVFCWNVQSGIEIDYATGRSRVSTDTH